MLKKTRKESYISLINMYTLFYISKIPVKRGNNEPLYTASSHKKNTVQLRNRYISIVF